MKHPHQNLRRRLGTALTAGLFVVGLGILSFTPTEAAINKQVNFQARLTNVEGNAVADGTYNLEFKLYNVASAGTAQWTETRSGASKVTVSRGLFSVQLGEVATLNSFNFNQDPLYLSVNIGGTGATPVWDGEMSPRHRLGAAPQAIEANHALTADNATNATTATNATQLNGNTAGNGSGQIALNNGTVNTNLNADLLDGFDSTAFATSSGSGSYIQNQNTADQAANFRINGNGQLGGSLLFGSTGDTNLYRSAADTLKTDDTFSAAGYKVGETAGATTTCAGGQFLQNQVVAGGITTGGTCAAASGGSTDLQGAYNNDATGVADIITSSAAKTLLVKAGNGFDSTSLFNVQNAGGTSVFNVDTTNQRVGIGTAGPGYKLDVQSNQTGPRSSQLALRGATNTNMKLEAGIDSTNRTGYLNALEEGVAWGNLVLQSGAGNVGIGTTAPGTKLDVAGNVRAGNADTVIGTHPSYPTSYSAFFRQGTDYSLLTDGSTTFLNAPAAGGDILFRAGNADKVKIQGSTGNVGIGTTAPGAKLDVAGDARVSGTASVNQLRQYGNGSSNLHIDAGQVTGQDNSLYLNYIQGSGGTKFGNGAGAVVGSVNSFGGFTGQAFYDLQNGNYYADPAGTSRLATVQPNIIQSPFSGGDSGITGARHYEWGYQEGGAWSGTYPDLILAYHTGVKLGAHPSYGGVRFYADHPSVNGTELFSVGNTDANVRVANSLFVNADLKISRHLITGGTKPTATVQAAAGGGGSCTVSGTDTAGTITVYPAPGEDQFTLEPVFYPYAGVQCRITFSSAYQTAPRVVVGARGAAAAAKQPYGGATTTTTFEVALGLAPTAYYNTPHMFEYIVAQ